MSFHHVIFVGNPGTGKSTILNSIVGRAAFRSGFCVGRGMTAVLQKVTHNNTIYADTPGLADIERKEQAAAEIKQILLEARNLTLIFVFTLEAGRVMPADVITMQVILKSMVDTVTKNRFGIVINKVSANAERHMTQENGTVILRAFQAESENFQTSFIYFNRKDVALEDVSDVVAAPNPGLERFIASITPVHLLATNVRSIDTSALSIEIARYQHEIAALHSANAERDRLMLQRRNEIEQQAEIHRAEAQRRREYDERAFNRRVMQLTINFEAELDAQRRTIDELRSSNQRSEVEHARRLALMNTQHEAGAKESIAETRRVEISSSRMEISHGGNPQYWITNTVDEGSSFGHVALCRQVCWFDCSGTTCLSRGAYNVAWRIFTGCRLRDRLNAKVVHALCVCSVDWCNYYICLCSLWYSSLTVRLVR